MSSVLSCDNLEALGRVLADVPDAVRLLGTDHTVLLSNEASRRLFPDGLGHLCDRIGAKVDPSCPACQLSRIAGGGGAQRWHVAVPRAGSPDRVDYFEITQAPLREADGRVAAVLEWIRDQTASLALEHLLIGESERQEEEIRERSVETDRLSRRASALHDELDDLRRTQAEALYRDRLMALGRLVAGVAHEVHTPLGAIASNVDLFRRTLPRVSESLASWTGAEAEGVRRKVRALESAAGVAAEGARRIERVIGTLRRFSRLDEAEVQRADLHEGIDSTVELIGYRLGDRVRVVRDYGSIPPVTCRPDALNQVFMNLLVNAVQSIPDSGEVRVCTRADSDGVEVAVSDTGTGISETDLARIFEPGFTTRSRGQGLGVGLAICKRIVEDHGGTIRVDSRIGEGTTFTVRLPRGGPGKEGS